jgi:hypothetical protein
MPWTVDELLALPIEHRLDRYAGIYRVPIVGIELEVARRGTRLTLGRPNGPAAPVEDLGDGLFEAEGITVQFEQDTSGTVEGARVVREGTAFPVSRVR